MDLVRSLRSRIARRFDDVELRTLCFDHFQEVNHEFTTGMTLTQMIQLLIDHCVRNKAGDALLTVLEQQRPGLIGLDRDAMLAWLNAAHFEGTQSGDNVASALHQLRAPIGDFVGRAGEIEQLTQAMRQAVAQGAVAAIGGIHGLGGIGKTELAYVVAHQLADTFPDAQIVVDLRGASDLPLSPVLALQKIIRAFERERLLSEDQAELEAIYRSRLSGKRVLILADDARDAAQIRPLLLPPGCALLVTSRLRFSLPGMHTIGLDILAPTEAEALLLAICPRIGPEVTSLARLCGYLPLALRISASLLRNNKTLPVSRYLEQLADERQRLATLHVDADLTLNLDASLALSYVALDSAAQRVLCQLSVFVATFDLGAARAVVMLEDGQIIDDVLGDLYRHNLLDYDTTLERYSLHDLVRTFARTRLETRATEALRSRSYLHSLKRMFRRVHLNTDAIERLMLRYVQYYVQVADQVDGLYLEGGKSALKGLALFDQERAHIDASWHWIQAHKGTQKVDTLLLKHTATIANVAKLRYNIAQDYLPRLQVYREIAKQRREHTHEGWALNELGFAYDLLGELDKAIDYHKQSLAIAQKYHNEQDECDTLSNIGIVYAHQGAFGDAITYYEQSLAIARKLQYEEIQTRILGNLGMAYQKSGKAQEAIIYYEQSLEIAGKFADWQSEEQTLTNLGVAYAALGEIDKAIDYHERSLAIANTFGDQWGKGQILTNMGVAYTALGKFDKAIDNHEKSLEIARKIGDQRSKGQILNNLGDTYTALGMHKEARNCYVESLNISHEVGDRWGEALASRNLG